MEENLEAGPSAPHTIELHDMEQAAKAEFPEDDWTGISNQALRRKLQNRVNQRLYRQRTSIPSRTKPRAPRAQSQAKVVTVSSRKNDEIVVPERIQVSMSTIKRELIASANAWKQQPHTSSNSINPRTQALTLFLTRTSVAPGDIDSKVYFPLSKDHLLTLIHYNVFRAIVANAFCLGFDPQLLCGNYVSPFNTARPVIPCRAPQALQPSELQIQVKHHPLIDLFPLPGIRDNLLRAQGTYDPRDLAADVFDTGDPERSIERNGLVVWGDPWCGEGWEVSEGFARKWGWALEGCGDILVATDSWREKRGERRLVDVLKSERSV